MFRNKSLHTDVLDAIIANKLKDLNDAPFVLLDNENIECVKKLISIRDDHSRATRVSPDTRAMIIANLAGLALIVGYEHSHVIASKAVGFVLKLR